MQNDCSATAPISPVSVEEAQTISAFIGQPVRRRLLTLLGSLGDAETCLQCSTTSTKLNQSGDDPFIAGQEVPSNAGSTGLWV